MFGVLFPREEESKGVFAMTWTRMLCLGFVLAVGAGVGFAADGQDIERLIQQLGSGKFAERDAAQKALDTIGPEALPALRKAAASDDAEISRRAKELIPALELRAETADATKPKRVHLAFKDQFITDAVQELKRLTSLPIALGGDTAALANKKVTLELKDVSAWEALDRFCAAANLAQDIVEETPARQPQPQPQTLRGQLRGGITLMDLDGTPHKKFIIRLRDGKPAAYPTTYVGALRIRAVPAAAGEKTPAKGEGEVKLEVLAEPGFSWRGGPKVRVDKAVDEKKQALTPVAVEDTPPQNVEEIVFQRRGQIMVQRAMIVNGNRVIMEELGASGRPSDWLQHVGVKLKLPDEGGSSLKQFKGMLQGRVTLPPQPLVTIDDPVAVAKSDNKLAKGKGIELKFLSGSREDDGTVKLAFELNGENAGFGNFGGGVQIIQGAGGQINFNMDAAADGQVRLLDGDGKPYRISGSNTSSRVNNGVAANEFRYTFTPPNAKSEPKKLEYIGSRHTTVEVPFELKDVAITRGQ
jgi:hypothetical protein